MTTAQLCICIAIVVYLLGCWHRHLVRQEKQLCGRLLSGRPEAGALCHRHERGGQRHVLLAADGPARRGLPHRPGGGQLDRHRSGRRHLSQLADRGPAHPPVLPAAGGHHRASVFSKRWKDERNLLSAIAAVVIIVFFIPYLASGVPPAASCSPACSERTM